MSPIELVQSATVTKVSRRCWSGQAGEASSIRYDVVVALSDGQTVRIGSESRTGWRRVVKKAGMRLTTKAARAAAAGLRQTVSAAVAAERAKPGSAVLETRMVERSDVRKRQRIERAAEERRNDNMAAIVRLMTESRITEEEALSLWRASLVADVMRA